MKIDTTKYTREEVKIILDSLHQEVKEIEEARRELSIAYYSDKTVYKDNIRESVKIEDYR